jgi:hypothetical protein
VNSGALEGSADPAPLVAPVMVIMYNVCKKATHKKASTSEIVWLNFVFGLSCVVNVVDVNNKDLSTFMHLMNERIQVWYKSNYKNFKNFNL